MKERLKKLVDVKSIVTLLLTGVFCYMTASGKIEPMQFMTVYTVIIAFYFGTQLKKKEAGNE